MRTTVTIDDELYRAAKERAARSGQTVGQVIEDGLRRALSDDGRQGDEPLPELVTFGGTGVLPGVDLTRNAALRE
jgi:hypothetical protein